MLYGNSDPAAELGRGLRLHRLQAPYPFGNSGHQAFRSRKRHGASSVCACHQCPARFTDYVQPTDEAEPSTSASAFVASRLSLQRPSCASQCLRTRVTTAPLESCPTTGLNHPDCPVVRNAIAYLTDGICIYGCVACSTLVRTLSPVYLTKPPAAFAPPRPPPSASHGPESRPTLLRGHRQSGRQTRRDAPSPSPLPRSLLRRAPATRHHWATFAEAHAAIMLKASQATIRRPLAPAGRLPHGVCATSRCARLLCCFLLLPWAVPPTPRFHRSTRRSTRPSGCKRLSGACGLSLLARAVLLATLLPRPARSVHNRG
ncbi:hypothetical protein FKP32DRAFT_349824 [Trametes sanguinea]|nr:hypothetical protein FKP32DRAFT_349824 [Trametes sanguinea]